ncbi:MAG: hypothetical protein JRM80_04940 [Nitrososphaerota archaeon]|nr:hypothetical protein [Nitrososphaerota archaeon]
MSARRTRRIPRSFYVRAAYALALIALIMVVGMIGMNELEGLSYVDSFYFMAMLATGEGPTLTPVTVAGKLFAGLMSFVSVGAAITSLLFLFGPFFGAVFRTGLEKLEKEAEKEKEKIESRD